MIGADRDVVLAGQDGKIEIWAAENYDKVDMSEEEFGNQVEKYLGVSNNESER